MMRMSAFKPGRTLHRKTPMPRGSEFKTPAAGAGLLRVERGLIKSAKTANRESR